MKTIVIDGQLWQTGAWNRGMGVYVRSLFMAYMTQHPEARLHIVVSKNLRTEDDRLLAIRVAFPNAEVHELDLPAEPKPGVGEEDHARRILNDCMATIDGDIVYFLPALFLFDFCAVYPDDVTKVALFHDLIPLIFRDFASVYAQYFPAHLYFPRFKTLFESDIIFTNSETTARDIEVYMGLPASRFVNLDGSLNESLLSPAQESTKNVLAEFGLTNKDYILLPTGGTPHKNNTVAVQAFALLGQTLSRPLKLVTTSHFRDYEKTELRAIAGEDIIFTDVISDDQLGALFNHARAVLFPSLYEGLGIPVLEAVAHGKPVACSDIDVFREIPHFNEAFYTFDPEDPFGMAEALLQATAEMGFEAKKQHYPDILEKYSWARSAKLFAEALEKPLEKLPSTTKRVAITCPDPRKNADVGKLVQRMYGHGLRRGVEFVYFIDPGGEDEIGIKIMADYIRGVAVCYDVQDLEAQLAAQSFDAIVHFLTDDRRFPALLHAALAHPGYMYVGNDDYLPVITTLRDKHMISSSQADAEKAYSPPHGLSGASFLANAKGIIAEKHVMKHIKAWLTHYKLSVPLLEVPESAVVMSGRDSRSAQDLVFNQIIDFIGVQKHV